MSRTGPYRWMILLLGTYVVICYGFVFQTIPPILASLIEDLSLSHTKAAALMGSFAIPAIFVAIPAGFLVDRFGAKVVGISGLLVFATGSSIVATGGDYTTQLLGRVVSGTGAVVLLVFIPGMIAHWFKDAELGVAIGVFNAAVPIGTVCAMMGLGVLGASHGWNTVLTVSAAVSVSALVVFLLFYRAPDGEVDGNKSLKYSELKSHLHSSGRKIWWLGIGWAVFGAGYFQFFTFAFEYFVAEGFTVQKAGLYASGPMLSGMLTGPAVGWLLDRYGRGWVFLLSGHVGLILTLGLIPLVVENPFALTLVIGVLASIVSTVALALPPVIMPAHTLGFGYGLLAAMLGLGNFLGATSLGLLRDLTGIAGSVFVGAAVISLLAIPVTLALRNPETNTE